MSNTLIIDRNSLSRYNLKLMLWKLGCKVNESDSDFDAISIMIKSRPEVIFISMEYQKQGFVQLVKNIRKIIDCKIVIYSDRITREDFLKCYIASVDDVLVDPYNQADRLNQYFRSFANNKLFQVS